MKKEISPEMYNYNKFPGPEFVHFDNHVKSDQIEFTLLENDKDAFNATAFGQRFTEILLKYDYIVGDWGNEQLRLKGFYKDANDIKKSNRISRLDDYIKEFCNFGCAYFVLENENPKEIKFEIEKVGRRKKSHQASDKRKSQAKQTQKKRPNAKSKQSDKNPENNHFTSKKRQNTSKSRPKKNRASKEQVSKAKNDHFIIRKKDSNP
ncbi:YutD family protein [Streptococcus catagoni]|uniref:YutD family protein n=1 Tax=Streptococcus catagoni TaxID=2654874 RepID=UPI00140A1A8C|nr:YutD family protein [Streptococcus catagoni]